MNNEIQYATVVLLLAVLAFRFTVNWAELVLAVRRLFFRHFKRYRRLELKIATYSQAEVLLRDNLQKAERERWQIAAKEEDSNRAIGYVYLERVERILE